MARFKKGTLDHDGNGKKGGSGKGKPKPPARKAKPAKAASPVRPADPADLNIFNLGRHARRGGRRREDSPLTGKQADIWRKGWDFQDQA